MKKIASWLAVFLIAGLVTLVPVGIDSTTGTLTVTEAACMQSDECVYDPGSLCWPPNEETYLEDACLKSVC